MFKTIFAALLSVSVLAAPAISAPYKPAYVPDVKAAPFSAKVLNANAHWVRHHRHRHHHWHFHHRHHRHWR